MKHGRPLPDEMPDEAWEAEDGWRRCHSQMVWQAIQAVVAVAVADEMARLSCDESRAWEDCPEDY